MKTMKKVFALLFAVMMLFSLTVTAFADGEDTHTLTINGQYTGHIYEAYQVFSGIYSEKDEAYYKLNNGTYTKVAPTADTYEDYVGGAEVPGAEGEEATYTATMFTLTKRILSDIEWGTGVDGAALLEALKTTAEEALCSEDGVSLFADCETAEDVADVLKLFANSSEEVDAFVTIVAEHLTEDPTATSTGGTEDDKNADGTYKYTIDDLAPGYYFVKDSDDNVGDNETFTKYILEVVDTLEITAKADRPTLEKYLFRPAKDGETAEYYELMNGTFTTEAPTEETKAGYVDPEATAPTHVKTRTADLSLGDKVPYQLETTVPNMDGYKTYTFTVTDTMSEGLTFNNDVKITLNGRVLEEGEDYTLTVDPEDPAAEGPKTITIEFLNFIQYKGKGTEDVGKPIVITYSATVNEKAKIGTVGNENAAKLTFSSNPYDDTVTGETVESKTYDYVTEIKLIKIDGETKETLTGAKFQISGKANKIYLVNEELFAAFTDEDEANNAAIDYDVENPAYITPYWRLKDGTYTTTDPEDVTDETLEKYESGEFGDYPKYKKVTLMTTEEVKEDFVAEGWVDENGVLTFSGLGAGTYEIQELVAPTGYNLLTAPIVVTIGWEAPENIDADPECTWTATVNNALLPNDDGIIELTVENKTGTTLPSTGGIGTTIFYILGSVLAVGAVILLVTKKRMGEDSAR